MLDIRLIRETPEKVRRDLQKRGAADKDYVQCLSGIVDELVHRLLEHEQFKNAAQMLQSKRMVEDASWTQPGIGEFVEAEDEPGLTVTVFDLVSVFRTIIERAKKLDQWRASNRRIVDEPYFQGVFTRDVTGRKVYIDHKINSIQNYIARDTLERYQMIDVNVYQENIFHTKMMLKEFDLDNYLFGVEAQELESVESHAIRQRLQKEMAEIFYGRNLRKLPRK